MQYITKHYIAKNKKSQPPCRHVASTSAIIFSLFKERIKKIESSSYGKFRTV